MKYLIILLLVILSIVLGSCGPTGKLRRAERLIAKAELQGAKWKVDTVFQVVEVTVPQIVIDSVFRDVHFTDTLVLTQNKVVTKVKINTVTREVYVKTKCPEQTKRIKVVHTVTKTIKAPGYTGWGLTWRIFVAVLITAFVMYSAFRLKIIH